MNEVEAFYELVQKKKKDKKKTLGDLGDEDDALALYALDDEDDEEEIDKGGPGSGPQESGGTQAKIHEARMKEIRARLERDKSKGAARDQKNNEMRMAASQRQVYQDQARHESSRQVSFKSSDSISKQNDIDDKKEVVSIFKIDNHKQLVYGEVLVPDDVDSQNDYMTAEDIETSAHHYLENTRAIGSNHSKSISALPVESYIAPQDFTFDGPYGTSTIKKGSWVLGVKIRDPKEWQKVLSGEYQGFSVGGIGKRV